MYAEVDSQHQGKTWTSAENARLASGFPRPSLHPAQHAGGVTAHGAQFDGTGGDEAGLGGDF